MKIVIESFLYNEEQILKESCKNWDFNIKSYTPKGGEVEANLQLESYCPNSQETLNLQFNQGEVFKVEMLKTIVFRFENPGQDCLGKPSFDYFFNDADVDHYLGVDLKLEVNSLKGIEPYEIFYVQRENFISYSVEYSRNPIASKRLLIN